MRTSPFRARRVAFVLLLGFAAATATSTSTSAGTLTATLGDAKDAPAYVSSCAIDNDSSGVFTPEIVVMDRKASTIAEADVAITFYDPANHELGTVIASPPYGPQGLPFGAVDRVSCKVKSARFVDGSTYESKTPTNPLTSVGAVAGALLGVGAAALLIGSNHGSSSSSGGGATPTPAPGTTAAGGATPTPVPVATIVHFTAPRATPKR